MPYDPHAWDDEEEAQEDARGPIFREFECPSCNAHNPYEDGFRVGDEVRCCYCGQDYEAMAGSGNRLRLREL
ncbi:MAG TPA: hypothetical protein VLV17_00540 [Anaeromyxobacteraceae bacterium]|nr:hypothetical protein [Anaeromyxobacteraceae bacterium]